MNAGETDLSKLIKSMKPTLNEGGYVFVSVKNRDEISRKDVIGEFQEPEGTTVILDRNKADTLGLSYEFVTSWITLKVHSSLAAVGLTAAFSTALAKSNISCNVIAGYYHDHIFVDIKDADRALEVLTKLSNG